MFVKLIDDLRTAFAARGFTEVEIVEGAAARDATDNFGAGSANRIAFVPAAGLQFIPPLQIGEQDDGRRQLLNMVFVYEVSFAGYDADSPERDLAHRRRCVDLLEATVQEVQKAAWGLHAWTSARWEDTRKLGRHGAELIATLEINIPIFDAPAVLSRVPLHPVPGDPKPADE